MIYVKFEKMDPFMMGGEFGDLDNSMICREKYVYDSAR
jgi:hypothetical protein